MLKQCCCQMCDTSEFVVAALTSTRPPFDCHMFLLMSVMSEFQEGMEYSGNLHRLMDEFFYLFNLQEIEIGALMFFHLIIYFTFNSILSGLGHQQLCCYQSDDGRPQHCWPRSIWIDSSSWSIMWSCPPCGAPPRPHERFDVRVSMSLTPVVSTAWER